MDPQEEALQARAEARVGTTLGGKYRLDRVLGIGGMAAVFAATHRNQAELAVKLLHAELSMRDDLKKRFLREGYVANSVKHPGAVLVVDDDVAEDGAAFLVMELLRGATIEAIWERAGRRLSTRAVTAITLQLLDVLAAAHEKAIVHRDLKPANLFLTTDASVKVLDFGIARLRDALSSSEHATRTGTLMGTPAFMAPEQAQAVADEIDGQTDLWAVGATMFTLLSGQLVHDGDNSSQLLIKAGTSRARPVESVVPGIEPGIAAVVGKALAFEKPSRYASATEMRDALLSAATKAFGKPPGRDDLSDLLGVEPTTRRLASAETERAPGTPRLILDSGSAILPNGPTLETPSSGGRAARPSASPATPVRASTAISGVQPPLQGLTTANPVSREADTLRMGQKRLPWGGIVTGVAVMVAVGAVAFALTRPKAEPVAAAPSTHAEPPPPSAPSPPLPSAPPAASPPPPTPVASAAVAPAPTVTPLPPPRTTTPPAAATPRTPAQPKADCSTPYTLDVDGNKKWKLECIQH